jgi:hypothetical protein
MVIYMQRLAIQFVEMECTRTHTSFFLYIDQHPGNNWFLFIELFTNRHMSAIKQPEALKSLYRSPGNKKNQLVLCKNYVLRHLGITINIKNTKFVKDLPMIDAQFRFNQCNSFREEYISVFSPYVLC